MLILRANIANLSDITSFYKKKVTKVSKRIP